MKRTRKDAEVQPEWTVIVFLAASTADQEVELDANIREILRQVKSTSAGGGVEFKVCISSRDSEVAILYDAISNGHAGGALSALKQLQCAPKCHTQQKAANIPSGKAELLQQVLHTHFTDIGNAERKTLLVLMGHAQGVASAISTAGSPHYSVVGASGFGYNPISGDVLSASDIALAIRSAKASVGGMRSPKLDLLAFDSCYMSAAEAAFELRGTADYLLASQSALPLAGFDYTALGNAFAFGPASAIDVARALLEQTGTQPDAPTTLTLINLHEDVQTAFARLLADLASALQAELGLSAVNRTANRAEWVRIRAAFENAAWHRVRQFIDLPDLCTLLMRYCRSRAIRTAAHALLNLLETRKPALDEARPRGVADNYLTHEAQSLIIDTRSAPPWSFGGLSIFCAWLLPTPEEAQAGAWNAALGQRAYRDFKMFTLAHQPPRSAPAPAQNCTWASVAWAPVLIEEARQNALNRELLVLRRSARPERGANESTALDDIAQGYPATSAWKPPNGSAFSEDLLYAVQSRSQVEIADATFGRSLRRRR